MDDRYRTVFDRKATAEDFHRAANEFWGKLKGICRRIPFARDAVALYYLMRDPKTDIKYKSTAVLALVYFISPVDFIPDAIPVIGYVDDAVVIAMAMKLLAPVMPAYRKQADNWSEDNPEVEDDKEVIKPVEVIQKPIQADPIQP
jgi:uncharacterized membrane protein YkvA (DUF1232 family)